MTAYMGSTAACTSCSAPRRSSSCTGSSGSRPRQGERRERTADDRPAGDHAGALRRHDPRDHRASGAVREERRAAAVRRGDDHVHAARTQPGGHRDDRDRARDGRRRRGDDRDADLRPGHADGQGAHRRGSAAAAGQYPARACGHCRVGHGRPDLQPGHPRRPGPGQRAGPGRRPLLGYHRRLALGALRRGVRRLGPGRQGGDRAAPVQAGAARLPDERDGRHPLRPRGDDQALRDDDRQRGPGPAVRTRPGGLRRRRRGARGRARGPLRDRPGTPDRASRVRGAARGCAAAHARGRRLRGLLVPLRLDRRRWPLRAAPVAGRLGPDGRRVRLRRRGRHQHRVADVRRPDLDRRCSLLGDVRDGLGARLGSHQPHGGGQLEDRADGPAGPPDRPPARDRWPRQPADAGLLGRARARDHGGADPDRGRLLPAAGGAGRGARHPGAAERRDALLPLPPGAGNGAVHGRVAPATAARTTSSPTSASTPAAGGGSPSCSRSTTR